MLSKLSVNGILVVVWAIYFGCQPITTQTGSQGSPSGKSTDAPTPSYPSPSPIPAAVACNGKNIGMYAWSQDYWRSDDVSLLDFLDSDPGRTWACGDLTINIADFTNPDMIHNSSRLVAFAQQYRIRVRNPESVLWLTYGDVVSKNGTSMVQFTNTFFAWAAGIPQEVAVSMGKIGLSFDVEHIDPQFTKQALVLAQQLKASTAFPDGSLLVQHTIEGDPNVVGTDIVMQYADSALAMVYRNYMHDPSGKYQDDSNLLSRLMWMLTEQCQNCLNDAYAVTNYKAKITIMIEASCKMGAGCGKLSFCVYSDANQGAYSMLDILQQMNSALTTTTTVSKAQYERLFSTTTLYAVHNWEWFRCYAPFSNSFQYSGCSDYQADAQACRTE